MIFQLLINGFVNGCVLALMALGFSCIYGTTRIFHFSHGIAFTAGAYFCLACLEHLKLGVPVSLALATLMTAVFGVGMYLLIYRPLLRRSASPASLLLSSIGFYVVATNVVAIVFGNELRRLQPSIAQQVSTGFVGITNLQFFQLLASLSALSATLLVLTLSPAGKKLRAIRDNPALAEVRGINVPLITVLAFGLGSALAGYSGILSSFQVGMDPYVGLIAILAATVSVIAGGFDSFGGAVLGAVIVGLLQSVVTAFVSVRWMEAATLAVLVLFLLFRPQGLVSSVKRAEEVRG